MQLLEEVWTNDVELHSERLSAEKSIGAEIRFDSRKIGMLTWLQERPRSYSLCLSGHSFIYVSYIIHAPNLKNGPRLAPIKKAAEFYIVRISENT